MFYEGKEWGALRENNEESHSWVKCSVKTLQRGNISAAPCRKRKSQPVEVMGRMFQGIVCVELRQRRTWRSCEIRGDLCEEGRMPHMELEQWVGPQQAGPTGCVMMF